MQDVRRGSSAEPKRSRELHHLIVLATDEVPIDRPRQHRLQFRIRIRFAGDRAIQPLCVNALEARQEMEAEKVTESEADVTLAMAVDVGLLHLHLRAMPQHTLDHGCDFGRGCGFELRINAGAVALDMPIDHDTAATVADVPLRHQVLIPGAKLLGVGGTCRRSLAPDAGMAGTQSGVDDLGDCLAHALAGDEAPPHIEQVPIGDIVLTCRHALEAGVSADPVQTEQQPFLQRRSGKVFMVRDGAESIGEADAQIGLFQHVEQTGHRPAPADLGLERDEACRVFLFFQWCKCDPAAAALEYENIGVGGQPGIEHGERLGHVFLHARNESVGVPGKPEGGIVFVPSGLEVRWQIFVGIAISIGTFDPDLLATQPLPQCLQRANLIGDPVDPAPIPGVALGYGVTPGDRHDTVERHGLLKCLLQNPPPQRTCIGRAAFLR